MAEYKLGEIETIFADIIWDNEPVTSRRLTEPTISSGQPRLRETW